ncbi:TPA: galactarate dehydratase [Klebsiella michiganensis]|uniref:Galactarate dehydratase (L-threo-forming) n=1 Tax=Klebsiella michiganensis TaxID=1134687 RepID=A0A443WJF2_9ENTR|nr:MULTISPECIES: galactarate dehydratase [Klebsiella]QLW87645.1 galactarate dehydratase [Klebsiella oxytoca]EKV5141976.1 galactarate dehydratase [Klebsiella michiganensis]ELT9689573.1 galactarate dehydratase [Klebsiella michiganensis]MBA4426644.1 galactarate dehydratase [Klebsiella michiganensis]MBA7862252.1 galactarate dehydratase [Klebsiella michiganensis]
MADIEIRQESPTAFYIKVHETDNVAIIVNDRGLKAGTRFPDGLTLVEHIPQGHKVALVDIPVHGEIIRYGEVIGYAVRDIPQGSWIDESLVELPKAPPLHTLPLATKAPAPLPPLEGYTFEGYRNADGSVGTKNLLGISTSVHCVAGVVDYVVKIIERDLLPKYPNVDGVVGLNHLYGCGVAINAPAAVVPIRTIHNLALNPNFGGEVMVIGLGCEKLQPERLLEGTDDVKSIPVDSASIVSLQDEKHVGFKSMVDDILQVAERHLEKLNQRQRETCPASELVVGMQCGGSDAFSGVTANPAVGYASDLLVRCGATVMFSEVTEVRDAIHLLTPRAINEEVGKRLLEEMAWYDNYLDMGKTDRSANPSPGNKKGGLANVVEKALGSIAKSGKSAIAEVLSPGQRPTKRGLIYAATPASDFVCGTQQVASGITVQVFTTGRGTPYGLVAVPVIKMATRTELANRWYDLMDINAGTIATGEETIEEVGLKLFEFILDVASGRKKTFSDQWGLHNQLAVFNPAPVT